MVRKLTLSVDEEVIARAKRLAMERNTSASAMFAHFVRSIGARMRQKPVGRLTRKATGVIKISRGKGVRELIEESLLEKYGRGR